MKLRANKFWWVKGKIFSYGISGNDLSTMIGSLFTPLLIWNSDMVAQFEKIILEYLAWMNQGSGRQGLDSNVSRDKQLTCLSIIYFVLFHFGFILLHVVEP